MSDDFRAGMFRPLQHISKLAISEENIRLLVVCISILGKVPSLMNRLRVVPHFPSRIVEGAKRERA